MTSSDLNQQTITVSGQSYQSLPFTGMNRIDAYFHESNGAVAWNSDPYLGMDHYWISNFSSGKDDERAVASSFLASAEFKQRYGQNVSNDRYVETLYVLF